MVLLFLSNDQEISVQKVTNKAAEVRRLTI
jgi:hypothetical protein